MESRKLNIAMVTDSFFPVIGGRENVINNSMKCLIKNQNAFLCIPKIDDMPVKFKYENLPYKVLRCNALNVAGFYLCIPDKKFKKAVEDKKIDIIHSQTKYGMLNYAFKLRKKKNVPIISSIHTNYIDYYKLSIKPSLIRNILLKFVTNQMNKCDALLSCSYYMKRQVEKMGVTTPVYVVKNGVDFYYPKMSEAEQIAYVNKKYNLNDDDFIFLYVGRMGKEKNLDFSLEILKQVLPKYKNAKMIFVGNGDYFDKFKENVVREGLIDQIVFTGLLTDLELLYAIYRRSNLFLFTSVGDNDPLTVVEASYNKTPSLVIEGTGQSERIADGKNGFICKYKLNDCVERVCDILDNKYDMEKISSNAKMDIPQSWDEVTSVHTKIYQDVIQKYDEKRREEALFKNGRKKFAFARKRLRRQKVFY